MTTRTRTPFVPLALLVAAGFVLLLSACSASDSDDSGDASTELGAGEATGALAGQEASGDENAGASDQDRPSGPPATIAAADGDAASGAALDADAPAEVPADDSDTQVVPVALQPADVGRSIVFTADLAVTVDDVTIAGREAQVIVEALGGILFGQETVSDPVARSVLTFKVRPDDFRTVLDRFAGLGDVDHQTVTADDVTERVVDLESRIGTAATSVGRLRELLDTATDLQAIAVLEGELLQRETQLEQLRGQLRTIEDQVSLATIVLVVTEEQPDAPDPAVELIQTAYEGHDGGVECPGDDDVRADEGDELTVCFVVTNTGNTTLTGIEVSDDVLGIDADGLVAVDGDPHAPLAPGEHLVLAYEARARPGASPIPEVTATAVDDDGGPLRVEVRTERTAVVLDVDADTSLPGFGDSLAAGGRAVQSLFGVVLILVGAVLPFIWIPALLAAGWAVHRRRHPGGTSAPSAG